MSGIVLPGLEAFFDFLATSADYRALGLVEYRFVDGNVLDLEADQIPASSPRIITVDRIRAGSRAINQTAGQFELEVEAGLSLCYEALGPAGARGLRELDEALRVIFRVVNSRLAKQSSLGAGSIVKSYELALGGLGPMFELANGSISTEVSFWRASLALRLFSEESS